LNERSGQKFVISTASNPHGVWETAVFEANEMFLPLDLTKPLLVLNASRREQAREQHTQVASAFETEKPSQMIRHYELEGVLPLGQLLYSESEGNVGADEREGLTEEVDFFDGLKNIKKYRLWTIMQKITLFLFLFLLVMCFVRTWWLLIPALLSLALNGVSYVNRMRSLGRHRATKDIDEVV